MTKQELEQQKVEIVGSYNKLRELFFANPNNKELEKSYNQAKKVLLKFMHIYLHQ